WFTLGRGYPILHQGPLEYGFEGKHEEITGRITHVIKHRAQQFLENRIQEKPFFLSVGFYATHSPWKGQADWLAESYRTCDFKDVPYQENYPFGVQNLESTDTTRNNPEEALAQYYAAVTEIDTAVGQLIDTLEASGQLENTVIIYTSDHGLNCGHHGIWGKGNGTLPLNMVEESIRIPLIVSHPAKFTAGTEVEEFVDHLDTFQTILACAGVDLANNDNDYPGQSYRPMLIGEQPIDWRKYQCCEYGPVRMISDGRFKLIQRGPGESDQFFDLENDPREMTDAINESAYQDQILELNNLLDRYFETYASAEYNGRLGAALPQTNFTEAWR
ncbi:MAG: sulfatase, partial [Anaerolineae bacterium]